MTSSDQPVYSTPVILDQPVIRGKTSLSEIRLRRPSAGELRGVSLIDLGNLNVIALQTILPRLTQPSLTAPEISALDPADLIALGLEVASFLLKKADRLAASPSA